MELVNKLKDKILSGNQITDEEAYSLLDVADKESLYAAAEEITEKMCGRDFDSCSIANVKSGLCSENCKWCAQSAHYATGCETYDFIDRDECMAMAADNAAKGVKRFSLVASGRAMRGKSLDKACELLSDIAHQTGISTCASMGLLSKEDLQKLWDAGVRRYHCNLESAPSHFATLCTTHTIDDKLATIKAAREIGFEVCSGGIIGMGESARQRVEFALTLREIAPQSIPINLLCPIAGTPLESARPLTDDEVLTTVAIFRMLHPRTQLRFAGGRSQLSRQTQLRAMRIAINGGIVGDLLTTVGSTIADDRRLCSDANYTF